MLVTLLFAARVLLGDPFPAATLPALRGQTVALPAAGHVVVVEVFATWCASCHEALPIVERLRSRFGDRVIFLGVSEDDGDEARAKLGRMVEATGLTAPILLDADHDLYNRLGIRKLPTAYVIDAEGVVRHIDNGFGPGYEKRLAGWIVQTLRAGSSR